MAKYLDYAGLQSLWAKIKAILPTNVSDLVNDSGYVTSSDVPEVIICGTNEYDEDTLIPEVTGVENNIYLVPRPPEIIDTEVGGALVGTAAVGVSEYTDVNNYYIEWVYKNSRFERVSEPIASHDDVIEMLKQLGFINVYGIVDSAIVDESLVG